MANAGWLGALGRALSGGAQTYMGVKQYQDDLARQSLLDALRQAAFEREGKYQEAQLGLSRQGLAERKRQFDIETDRWMLNRNLEAEMEGVRSREAADLRKALINLEYDRREGLLRLGEELKGGGQSTPMFRAFNPADTTINKALDVAMRQMQGTAYTPGSGNIMGNYGNIMDWLAVEGGYKFPPAPHFFPKASPTTGLPSMNLPNFKKATAETTGRGEMSGFDRAASDVKNLLSQNEIADPQAFWGYIQQQYQLTDEELARIQRAMQQ